MFGSCGTKGISEHRHLKFPGILVAGTAQAASDGNIYVLYNMPKTPIYVFSPAGEIVKTVVPDESKVGKAQTIYESEMALFPECMQSCAHIVLDTADIVRDGDFSPTINQIELRGLYQSKSMTRRFGS
jgi:hypothetical protein